MVVLPKGKLAVIDGLEGFLIAESDNVLLMKNMPSVNM